ncbi:MAG: hypothetical protein ACLQDM_21050 [Bradyrhizobium sp.]
MRITPRPPHNIQVNAIAPGWIETDMTAAVRRSPMNDEIIARTPDIVPERWVCSRAIGKLVTHTRK